MNHCQSQTERYLQFGEILTILAAHAAALVLGTCALGKTFHHIYSIPLWPGVDL